MRLFGAASSASSHCLSQGAARGTSTALVHHTLPSPSNCLMRSRTEVHSPAGFSSSCGMTLATSTIFPVPSTVALGLAVSTGTSTTLSRRLLCWSLPFLVNHTRYVHVPLLYSWYVHHFLDELSLRVLDEFVSSLNNLNLPLHDHGHLALNPNRYVGMTLCLDCARCTYSCSSIVVVGKTVGAADIAVTAVAQATVGAGVTYATTRQQDRHVHT